jgi:hypothetical protein
MLKSMILDYIRVSYIQKKAHLCLNKVDNEGGEGIHDIWG